MKKVIKLVAALVVLSVALIVSAQAQSDLLTNTNYANVWHSTTQKTSRITVVTNIVKQTGPVVFGGVTNTMLTNIVTQTSTIPPQPTYVP